jgi:isopropylmalate/homocitrate/citramalate synthase
VSARVDYGNGVGAITLERLQKHYQEVVSMSDSKSKWLTDKYWVTEFNYLDEIRKEFTLPEKVRIHDVTLREAEQTPHVALKPDEKLRIYEALDEMGVYSVELLPIISSDDREVAKELVRMRKAGRKTKIVFLCRWSEKEVEFAAEAGADGVVVECPASPWFGKVVWDLSEDQMVDKLVTAASLAKKLGLETSVMPWEATKTPMAFLERLYKAVGEAGVDQITYTDTMGFGLPPVTIHMVRKIREWAPNVTVALHAHNDFGLATSFMLSGIIGGAVTVHTAMNTLGERAGNASTEEVVMGTELLLGVETGVNLNKIYPTANLVSELTKIPIPSNKPITGNNEFTFESGMVVDMTLRMSKTDKPFTTLPFMPELIGRSKGVNLILGKMSGGTIIKDKLEKLGLSATKEQVAELVDRVKREAIVRKWSISDEIFESIAREVLKAK